MAAEERFRPARLVARTSAGGPLVRVVVEPAAELLATHVTPGQYVEMRTGAATGFFVLSSAPGAAPWELVMRPGGGASDVVLTLPEGSSIELTGALGEGFPVDEARGLPLLVVLNGTGIAAGPPVVRRRIHDGDAARTRVFVGIRDRGEVPIEAELVDWVGAGVEVTVCLSQDSRDDAITVAPSGLRFARGYVQDVVGAEVLPGSASGGFVFAVGTSSMIDALRSLAPALGLGPERIRTNY